MKTESVKMAEAFAVVHNYSIFFYDKAWIDRLKTVRKHLQKQEILNGHIVVLIGSGQMGLSQLNGDMHLGTLSVSQANILLIQICFYLIH